VAKSFGTYAATFLHAQNTPSIVNAFALGIVGFFLVINLIGATFVAKSETLIVLVKITILTVFAVAAAWHIDPALLSAKEMPPLMNMLYAIGLTFFAYQGFSVITNTVEDMEDPARNMMRAMIGAILIVAALYVLTAVAVLGNLPLSEVIKTKDYALAEAAKPVFGVLGFKVMAATALLATASAINATLYATAEIGYTMAKEGNLPKVYSYNVFQSNEGLIISSLLIVPLILFFDLSEVTTVAALAVLVVQGLTHVGHLMRLKETGANGVLVFLAAAAMFGITALTLDYTRRHDPAIGYYLLGAFVLCFLVEVSLRIFTKRIVTRQIVDLFNLKRWEDEKKR
jgi:amino acid transporter